MQRTLYVDDIASAMEDTTETRDASLPVWARHLLMIQRRCTVLNVTRIHTHTLAYALPGYAARYRPRGNLERLHTYIDIHAQWLQSKELLGASGAFYAVPLTHVTIRSINLHIHTRQTPREL